MAFWTDPLWFGRQAGSGGTRIPSTEDIDLGVPVHTLLIEVLRHERPDLEVWSDVDRSGLDYMGASLVVQALGGDAITTTVHWRNVKRTFRIIATAKTSDEAERVIDDVSIIVKRRRDAFNFVTATYLAGGYDHETETFQRGIDVTFRGRA